MKTYDELERQFIGMVEELDSYDRASNLLKDESFDPKKTRLLGKKIHNLAVKMIECDIDRFIELLDYDNLSVSEAAAEYVYPVFPKKSLSVMRRYMDSLDSDADKIKIKSKIEGLERGDDFFAALYKKLYKTDDLKGLCRE
ncbi:MAG: hypothetical protein LUD27_05355 [Clostridia bacterium]|nr:hypothetical protein [Clostridia bacterium]